MPSIREKQTKDGRTFYEIQVSRGRSRSRLTSRWYPPEGQMSDTIEARGGARKRSTVS